nr:hypothetical protein [Bartonella queenslandensis]
MKLIKKVIVVCVVLCLVGCGINRGVSCVGWLPIYLDREDIEVISRQLARDILKHNKQGAHLCGWHNGEKTK